MGPNKGSNVAQNQTVRWIATKYDMTLEERREYSVEIHYGKKSGAYDPDMSGNLTRADLEEVARSIVERRPASA